MDAPADREASIIFHPHFSWKPVPGATRYLIELGMDRDFRKVVDRDSLDAVIHWYVTDKRLAPGEYFWRVRAEQGCEGDGPWSNVRAFQVLTPRKTFTIHPGMEARKIQQIGREAAAAQSALIVFEKGEYRLDLGRDEPLFRWRGADQIIIDGGGSSIFKNPSAPLVDLTECRRIMIGNMLVSNDPFDASLAMVLETNSIVGTLDAEILDGFDGVNYPWEVNQFFCYAVDPLNPLKKHPSRPGHTYLAWGKTEDLGQRRRRFHVASETEKGSLKALKPGDKLLMDYRRWALNNVKQCEDITFYQFSGGTPEGGLFMGGGNKDMKFLNLINTSLKGIFPGAGTWVTGNDRRGPWIEGCSWEALPDDGPNITGNCYLIEKVIAPNRLHVNIDPAYQNPILQPGDEIVFWNSNTGLPIVETTVVAAEE